jgi:regulating synaptic membrane exocytosis protein 2
VCILCRKKQELLSKTGQWINKASSPEGLIRHVGGVGVSFARRNFQSNHSPRSCANFFLSSFPPPSPDDEQTTLLNPHDTSDKRPKLERARSAAEKENQPLQRTGSQLRRQYSQQETSTQRRASASASDSGVDDNYLQRSHLHSQHPPGIGSGGSNVDGQYMNQSPQYRNTSSSYYPSPASRCPPENDPRYYQVRNLALDLLEL